VHLVGFIWKRLYRDARSTRPYHLHVIQPQTPDTLSAYTGLCRDCFTFTFTFY